MKKNLLMWDETLFRDPEVLEIDYVPEQFEFRDAQMRELAFQIRPGLRGGRPLNTICKGLPGTGKTTSIRKLFAEIEETTKKLVPVYINCQIDNTKFAILSQIYKKLAGHLPPSSGTSFKQVFDAVARILIKDEIPTWPADAAGGRRVVLEGGAIDVDGEGTLLTTEECLLSPVQARNPGLSRADVEGFLGAWLGDRKVVWLGEGIVGDDTHGHVDDLARFVDGRTVAVAVCGDPGDENYARLRENRDRLRDMTDQDDAPLRVVELPMPAPATFEGERLPASYANFYIGNGVVLVPTFNDPADRWFRIFVVFETLFTVVMDWIFFYFVKKYHTLNEEK